MLQKLSICERKSKAIGNILLCHQMRSFNELIMDYPGLAGQVERRLGWWIEGDVRALEAAQELGSFGIVAGLMSFSKVNEHM